MFGTRVVPDRGGESSWSTASQEVSGVLFNRKSMLLSDCYRPETQIHTK